MELELEQISNESIRPSSPTPFHLKNFKLSLLDQLFSLYEYSSTIVLFYAPPPTKTNGSILTVARMKASLAKALSIFYPLAGRLMAHESAIDCNDEGVPLVVARAKCSLFTYLASPNRIELVPLFLPKEEVFLNPSTIQSKGLAPTALQISVFDCGALSIGVQSLHSSVDGTCYVQFLKTWATIFSANDENIVEITPPDFTTAISLFPPSSDVEISTTSVPWVYHSSNEEGKPADGEGKCIVKAFEFDASSIAALQFKAKSERVPNPSRIEALTCFLWKQLMASAAAVNSSNSNNSERPNSSSGEEAVIHSVNIRPHLNPPLPSTCFGNIVTHAFAYWQNKDNTKPELSDMVAVLRNVFKKTKDPSHLSMYQGIGGLKAACQHKEELEDLLPKAYYFASWQGFDEVKFGSNGPVWLGFNGGRVCSRFRNFVPLIRNSGNRVEAWLILDEQQMALFESDPELLAYARPTASASLFSPKPSL